MLSIRSERYGVISGHGIRVEKRLIPALIDGIIQKIEIGNGQTADIGAVLIGYDVKIEPMDFLKISFPGSTYIFHAGLFQPVWIEGCLGVKVSPPITIEENIRVTVEHSPRIRSAYLESRMTLRLN